MTIDFDLIDHYEHRAARAEAKLKRIEQWASTPVHENGEILYCDKCSVFGYEMAQALVEKILRGDE